MYGCKIWHDEKLQRLASFPSVVNFCRGGVLSVWSYVGVGYCRLSFFSCGLLSEWGFVPDPFMVYYH